MELILKYWFGSSLFSVVISLIIVWRLLPFKMLGLINWDWIKVGIKASLYFFGANFFFKLIEYSDRYIIDYFLGKELLGVYSYYFQFGNLINLIILTVVFSYEMPRLYKAISKENSESVKITRMKISKTTSKTWIFLVLAVLPLSYILNLALGKPLLDQYFYLVFFTIISSGFFNLFTLNRISMVGHKMEINIFKIVGIGFMINIALNFALIPLIGLYGAGIGSVLSFAAIGLIAMNQDQKNYANG